MEREWYAQLIRPEWAPPAWLFGPVWTVLYTIIFITFGWVAYKYLKKQLDFSTVLPFILNLFFNALFSPIQFGLQNNFLAMIDIFLVLGTIIWMFFVIWKKNKWIVYANIPYLLWVSFATVLQVTITILNWG
ncbi:tryptophan-rich sensory protein [Candidatus Dojkabacteria bacterium]|uniref:Tryptophan-rich sensory protein n=1 Tax=Candidatus Dojkabacteria bacterium TaxID=2099670 RepID=A0A955L7Z5_9BACT|nr:tryptophan-rich sensory protein [Candidatus Dojkabacteria bacterium]